VIGLPRTVLSVAEIQRHSGGEVTLNEQIDLLREMRDLLRVIAEPALAKRDEKLRTCLRDVVGKSKLATKAVLVMDGARSQSAICKEAGIDQGNLSKLVKSLRAQALLASDDKHPKLMIAIPPNFFEHEK
jgi:hypothetical protein